MGKGDRKTKKGKIAMGSFGVTRVKKAPAPAATATKAKPKAKAEPKADKVEKDKAAKPAAKTTKAKAAKKD